MKKLRKKAMSEQLVFLVVILIAAGVVYFGFPAIKERFGSVAGVDLVAACGDDKQATVTLNLANGLNTSGAEVFDATYYMIGAEGDYETGTATTGETETLNCGEEYTLYVVAEDADNGDNSKATDIVLGVGAKIVDGNVVFTPNKDQYALRWKGSQHGVLEFKAWDNDAAGWMCDSDDSCSAYETDGVTFESTTNGTALAVGSGGQLDLTITARATRTDTDFSDFYTLILVEAPVATWEEPIVKVDGVRLYDQKGSLTPEEEKQFSSYEYIYKLEKPIDYAGVDIDFHMDALAGVDPSTDPQIDFAAAGNYLSVDGVTVKRGAAKDDSSSSVVYTVQDITIDIT